MVRCCSWFALLSVLRVRKSVLHLAGSINGGVLLHQLTISPPSSLVNRATVTLPTATTVYSYGRRPVYAAFLPFFFFGMVDSIY